MENHTFSTVQRQNLSDVVYHQIRLALMQSRLKPNDKLVIRKLSDELGISMTPIREALLRLVSEQVLVLDSRGTAMVPELDYRTFQEIYDLRADLESKAAMMAAATITGDEIDALQALHDRMEICQNSGDLEQARELNAIFHASYCAHARSPILEGFIATLWMRCGPLMAHIHRNGPQVWEGGVHPHQHLLEGLRAKDLEQIRHAVRYDILHGGKELLAYVKENS